MFALAVLETQPDALTPQMMFAFLSLLEQQMTLHGYRGFAAECLFQSPRLNHLNHFTSL